MRKAVITGSSGGIGSATCEYFKNQGWHVIGVDRVANAESQTNEFYECDLADPDQIEQVFGRIAEAHSGIDALVNNAARHYSGSILGSSIAEFDMLYRVNQRAPALAIQYLEHSLRSANGSIVNVGSIMANRAANCEGFYAVTKAALHGLTQQLVMELAPEVRVNTVVPGAVHTSMLERGLQDRSTKPIRELLSELAQRHPLKRIGKPEEVAKAIYFLADSEQSGSTTGEQLLVDGGASLLLGTVGNDTR